jgi:3D-(3,5/4)-trihydroxycyclohexane-1,2-dione acylhydrolase (decyclizing)
MMPSEIITSLQEGYKINIVLIDNNGFASIGGLSKSIGSEGFGTKYQYRNEETGQMDGAKIQVDLAANAESLGAKVFRAKDIQSLNKALEDAKAEKQSTVIYIETVPERKIAGYGHAWWDVPIAEVSKSDSVKKARANYDEQRKNQRYFF